MVDGQKGTPFLGTIECGCLIWMGDGMNQLGIIRCQSAYSMRCNEYILNETSWDLMIHGISWHLVTNLIWMSSPDLADLDRWSSGNCHFSISLSQEDDPPKSSARRSLGIPGWWSWSHNFRSPAPENARCQSWLKRNWLSSCGRQEKL